MASSATSPLSMLLSIMLMPWWKSTACGLGSWCVIAACTLERRWCRGACGRRERGRGTYAASGCAPVPAPVVAAVVGRLGAFEVEQPGAGALELAPFAPPPLRSVLRRLRVLPAEPQEALPPLDCRAAALAADCAKQVKLRARALASATATAACQGAWAAATLSFPGQVAVWVRVRGWQPAEVAVVVHSRLKAPAQQEGTKVTLVGLGHAEGGLQS